MGDRASTPAARGARSGRLAPVPVSLIAISNSENPDQMVGPFENAKSTEVRSVMEQAFEALRATGYSPKEAVVRLRTMEPFPRFPAELHGLAEAKGIAA